jgi:hypothetical protein
MKPEQVTVLLTEAKPPDAEADPSTRLQKIMGLEMTKSSADKLKWAVVVAGVMVLILFGMAVWFFVGGDSRRSKEA